MRRCDVRRCRIISLMRKEMKMSLRIMYVCMNTELVIKCRVSKTVYREIQDTNRMLTGAY